MNMPNAADLFLNLWNQSMFSEEAVWPGTPGWARAKLHWVKVWQDCSELCRQIKAGEELAEKAIKTGQPAEVSE